jgi:hypothetical protein
MRRRLPGRDEAPLPRVYALEVLFIFDSTAHMRIDVDNATLLSSPNPESMEDLA